MRLVVILFAALALTACTTENPTEDIPQSTPVTGEMCGGIIGATCTVFSDYCHFDIGTQCGATDQTGTCTVKPEACTMDYNPVCGCDGKTYSNSCVANSNGVSVASVGACDKQ